MNLLFGKKMARRVNEHELLEASGGFGVYATNAPYFDSTATNDGRMNRIVEPDYWIA